MHQCRQTQLEQYSVNIMDESYEPHPCLWLFCDYGHVFETRRAWLDHFTSRHVRSTICSWDGCSVSDIVDIATHFAEYHDLNVRFNAKVQWCYLCSQWSVAVSPECCDDKS